MDILKINKHKNVLNVVADVFYVKIIKIIVFFAHQKYKEKTLPYVNVDQGL
jgi:hypothetical protein